MSAIRSILFTEDSDLTVEEARPYRHALTAKGLHEAEELVRTLGDDPRSRIQVISGYMALARVQFDAGQAAAAAESGRKSLALAEEFDARTHSAESRLLLATILHRLIGQTANPAEIRDHARRSNAILEAMAAERPAGPLLEAHLIALNHYNIGHSFHNEGEQIQAAAAFRSSIRVCEDAIHRGDRARIMRLDLARSLVYLERALIGSRQYAKAIEPGRRAIATYRALLEETPADIGSAMLLYLAEEELSYIYTALKQWDQVIACHREARAVLDDAARRNRGVVSRRPTSRAISQSSTSTSPRPMDQTRRATAPSTARPSPRPMTSATSSS